MALTKVTAGVIKTDELLGFRNKIINGAMEIDQRNAGSNVTINLSTTSANGQFVTDRWQIYGYNISGDFDVVANVQQFSDHPVSGNNGKCLRIVITTGDTPNTANVDFLSVIQRIEGTNGYDLINAPLSLSFWVKTNVTGTYGIQLRANGNTDGLQNPNFWTTFNVTQSGIWQYITKSIPAQTLSTIRSDNQSSITLHFNLVSGLNSNYDPNIANLNNTWARYNSDGPASTALSNTLTATAGNYFQITEVQLEKGSAATPFERRPYGTELQLCQRYFQIFGGTGTQHFAGGVMNTNRVNVILPFLTQMRTSPSFSGTDFGSAWSNFTIYYGGGSITATGTNENYPSPTSISFGVTHAGSTTAGQAGYIYANSTNARLSFSAEL